MVLSFDAATQVMAVRLTRADRIWRCWGPQIYPHRPDDDAQAQDRPCGIRARGCTRTSCLQHTLGSRTGQCSRVAAGRFSLPWLPEGVDAEFPEVEHALAEATGTTLPTADDDDEEAGGFRTARLAVWGPQNSSSSGSPSPT